MSKGSKVQDLLEQDLLNPDFAAEYLAAALEENDEKFLTQALAQLVRIHGSSRVAEETGIARQALYKMFSSEGNPSYKNISKILDVMGMEFTIQPKKKIS